MRSAQPNRLRCGSKWSFPAMTGFARRRQPSHRSRIGRARRLALWASLAATAMTLLLVKAGFAEPALSRQVLIEASIWEINQAANIDYGIIWDLVDMDREVNDILDSSIYLPGFLSGTSGQTTNPVGAFFQTTLDIRRDVPKMRYQPDGGWVMTDLVARLNTTLQAATRDGTVQLRANPKIVVVENQQAVIHAGDKFPIVQLTVTKQGLPTLQTVYHDTGVKLTVWPTVYRDEFVILAVRPEVTDITSFVEQSAPPPVEGAEPQLFRLPVLSTRDAYSQMIVRSGGTVIMSGLLMELESETTREVPILGKIPILGWLFRSRNWTRSNTDILIEITPTILQAGESRYTPNGLIYDGELFQSDSDIVRQLREAEREPSPETPAPGRAEAWFGVTPAEEPPPHEAPVVPPAEEVPTEETPSTEAPLPAPVEATEATPESAGG
jgi:type II secretory pathway component GspD/PulD (secretin)